MFDHILVDGNYLARKMFAIHKRLYATVDGEKVYTGLAHGFLSQLLTLKREYEGKIIVVWDSGIKRRREIYKDYKRKRREKEWDELDLFISHQFVMRMFIDIAKVRTVRMDGEEGDDILYTLSRHTNGRKLIVSNDHDMHQALTPEVFQLITRRGDYNMFGLARLKKKYGVTPEQYADAMAIAGCSGDGVPGVKGIGMKTAIAVVKKWPNFVPAAQHAMNNGLDSSILESKFVADNGREQKIIDGYVTVVKTRMLTKLYDLWPVKIKMGKLDLDHLENELERYEMHELASKIRQFRGLVV